MLYSGFILLSTVTTTSWSQDVVVCRNARDGAPVIGARISITGAGEKDSTVAVSDAEGKAFITLIEDSTLICVNSSGFEKTCSWKVKGLNLEIYLTESDIELNPIVISAQYEPGTKTNSMYDVDVVTSQNIEKTGTVNMQEVLNSQLNFRTNNGHTNETALMINGLSGAHVKFMIDGVPVEGRVNGNVDLSQINTSEVERIEIIEGPVSVVYGTNALGGIVNVISKRNQTSRVTPYLNSYYESVGKYNIDAGVGIQLNKSLIRLSGGRHFFAGFSTNDSLRSSLWLPREQYFGRLSYNRPVRTMRFSLVADGFHEFMLGRGDLRPPYYTTAFDTYYTTDRLNTRGLLNGRLKNGAWLDLTAGYSAYARKRNIYFKDLVTLNSWQTDGESDQDTTVYHNGMFRAYYSSVTKKSVFSWLIGTEVRYDGITSSRIQDTQQTVYELAGFTSFKYEPFKWLAIQPALRYTYNSRYKSRFVPSLISRIKQGNSSLSVSYAKGFRTPDLKELFLEFHYSTTINIWGNPDLKPEDSDHLIVDWSWSMTIGKSMIRTSLKGYLNRIQDMIDVVRISDVDWEYANVGAFRSAGGSAEVNYKRENLKIGVGGTVLGMAYDQFADDSAESDLLWSVNSMVSADYTIAKWNLGFNLLYKYTGKLRSLYLDENGNLQPSFIGDYNLLNLSLYKKLWNEKLAVVVGCKNLTNTVLVEQQGSVFGYSSSSDAQSSAVLWGRTFFLSVNWKL